MSEFHGIVITVYYREHNPPRFHAEYGGFAALVGIDPIAVIEGRLPARVRSLVLKWAFLHQSDLAENRQRARRRQAPVRIGPLPRVAVNEEKVA